MKILHKNIEIRFFDNIPIKDEGYALSNKIAGIEPSKKDQKINFICGKQNYLLESKNLKEHLIQNKKDFEDLEQNYKNF